MKIFDFESFPEDEYFLACFDGLEVTKYEWRGNWIDKYHQTRYGFIT